MPLSKKERLMDTASVCMALVGDPYAIKFLRESDDERLRDVARKSMVMNGIHRTEAPKESQHADELSDILRTIQRESMFHDILNQEALTIVEGKVGGKTFRFDFEKDEVELHARLLSFAAHRNDVSSLPAIDAETINYLENASMAYHMVSARLNHLHAQHESHEDTHGEPEANITQPLGYTGKHALEMATQLDKFIEVALELNPRGPKR